jgi:hypothetical protein
VTAETVSHFISRRVREDGIAPKTANRIREVLHVLFAYAIKEKGYHGRLALFAQADQAQLPALGRGGGAPRKARAARILLTG